MSVAGVKCRALCDTGAQIPVVSTRLSNLCQAEVIGNTVLQGVVGQAVEVPLVTLSIGLSRVSHDCAVVCESSVVSAVVDLQAKEYDVVLPADVVHELKSNCLSFVTTLSDELVSRVSSLNSQLVAGTEGSHDDDVCSDSTDNSRVSVVSGDSCTSAVKCDPVLCDDNDELIVDVENVDGSVSHSCMEDLKCDSDVLPSAEKTGFSFMRNDVGNSVAFSGLKECYNRASRVGVYCMYCYFVLWCVSCYALLPRVATILERRMLFEFGGGVFQS